MDKSTSFTFISLPDPNEASTRKQQQQLARTHAIRFAIERKRRVRRDLQNRFIPHQVPSSAERGTSQVQAPAPVSPRIPRRSWTLALDTIDPFESLAVQGRRLTFLLTHHASRQAGEPVFSLNTQHDWQSFGDVCANAFCDPALVHAVCLTLAFAANGGRLDGECLFYRLRSIQRINSHLSNPSEAVSQSVITAILLLAGVDARHGDAKSAQAHLKGMQQVVQLCNEQMWPLGHSVKRAMFW
jgi:hypothetical protein